MHERVTHIHHRHRRESDDRLCRWNEMVTVNHVRLFADRPDVVDDRNAPLSHAFGKLTQGRRVNDW